LLEKSDMANTKTKIAEIQTQIQRAQGELANEQIRALSLLKYGRKQAQQIDRYFNTLLANNQQVILNTYATRPPQNVAGWDKAKWEIWNAEKTGAEKLIRIGDMVEQDASCIVVPGYIPFIGGNKTIIITSSGATNFEQAKALLQSLVIRTAFMLPHQSKYTLIDPAGGGIAFPMRRHLPQVRQTSNDVRRDLEQVL
jgi:S-DNA-T family DNA segregation ATPase FtsK/SpoIIIE